MRVVPNGRRDRFVYSLEVKRDWSDNVDYETPAQLSPSAGRVSWSAALRLTAPSAAATSPGSTSGSATGVPYFLEANPLPGLAPGWSDLVILARGHGIEYADLIGRILDAALARLGLARTSPGRSGDDRRAPGSRSSSTTPPILPAGHPRRRVRGRRRRRSRHGRVGRPSPRAADGLQTRPPGRRRPPDRAVRSLDATCDAGPRPGRRLQPDRGFGGSSARATLDDRAPRTARPPLHGLPVRALALCLSKSRAKALLRGSACRRPRSPSSPGERDPRPGLAPARDFVKPDAEDASLGIDQGSVVADRHELAQRVERSGRVRRRSLIEAYLPGPEYNVGAARPARPRAAAGRRGRLRPAPARWPILTYAAKWVAGSAADLATPGPLPGRRSRALAALARPAGRRGLQGDRMPRLRPGRFPARRAGEPMILEVNPEPRPRPDRRLGAGVAGIGPGLWRDDRGAGAQAQSRGPLWVGLVRGRHDRPIVLLTLCVFVTLCQVDDARHPDYGPAVERESGMTIVSD